MKYFFPCLVLLMLSGGRIAAQRPEMFLLSPGPEVAVPVGGKLDLRVLQMNTGQSLQLMNASWTLDGKEWNKADPANGELRQQMYMGSAVYTAPQQIPRQNPVIVTVAFKLSDTSKTLVMLSCSITVTDGENYFYLTNGELCKGPHEFVKPANTFMAQMMGTATYTDGELIINISGSDVRRPSSVLSMAIEVAGNGPGTYSWSVTYAKNKGTTPPTNLVSVGGIECSGSWLSIDNVPHGSGDSRPISLNGSTTITRYDREKKVLQGYFGGQVVTILGQQYHYANVYGRFTVHLK